MSSLPKPVACLEGGVWFPWDGAGRPQHFAAIKFENGWIFDNIRGWLPGNDPMPPVAREGREDWASGPSIGTLEGDYNAALHRIHRRLASLEDANLDARLRDTNGMIRRECADREAQITAMVERCEAIEGRLGRFFVADPGHQNTVTADRLRINVNDLVRKSDVNYMIVGRVLATYAAPYADGKVILEEKDMRAVVHIEPQCFQHIYRWDQLEVIGGR